MLRWVVYAGGEHRVEAVAAAVVRAGAHWKPVVVHPSRLSETVSLLRPAMVVLAAGMARLSEVRRETGADAFVLLDDADPSLITEVLATL